MEGKLQKSKEEADELRLQLIRSDEKCSTIQQQNACNMRDAHANMQEVLHASEDHVRVCMREMQETISVARVLRDHTCHKQH